MKDKPSVLKAMFVFQGSVCMLEQFVCRIFSEMDVLRELQLMLKKYHILCGYDTINHYRGASSIPIIIMVEYIIEFSHFELQLKIAAQVPLPTVIVILSFTMLQ